MKFSQFHWAGYCTFYSVVSLYPLSVFITSPEMGIINLSEQVECRQSL